MSGYFARLAAQVNGPSAPDGHGAVQEPASLERRVEVEVEVPASVPLQEPMEGVAASRHLQRAPAVANGAQPEREPRPPEPPAAGSVDAERATTVPGQGLLGRETPSMPPERADTVELAGPAFTPDNGEAIPAGPPAHRMAAEAANPGAWTAAAFRPASVLDRGLPDEAAGSAPARPYAGFTASTARPGTADAAQPHPARPSTRPEHKASAPHNGIRIGTITLEVRPPAAPAPAAQQSPPAATPAPQQQVALRRHYLRWS